MSLVQIRPLEKSDLSQVRDFCDRWIGKDYYSLSELEQLLNLSKKEGKCCSFCAWDNEKLVGIRLTLAPGDWAEVLGINISPKLWRVSPEKVAYFKSLFVHKDYQKQGVGRELSTHSIDSLKSLGAKAILCHSWLESPGNSSQRYLSAMGFEQVKTHPKFWYAIDYDCPRCSPKRCECTAVEMILYLGEKD